MKEKLVRDGYAQIIDPARLRVAEQEEMPKLLRKKFWEELWEVQRAAGVQVLSELGDLAQVVLEMETRNVASWWHRWLLELSIRANGVLPGSVEYYRQYKMGERGGFSQRLVLRLNDE